MSKSVLIISASLRNGSNSDLLAKEFARGAREMGHSVEEVALPVKISSSVKDAWPARAKKTGIAS